MYLEALTQKAIIGDARAQSALGDEYAMAQDFADAAKWYRKAAEQGEAKAQNYLGSFYRDGLGVHQDYSEAAKWLSKSAEQGHGIAQLSLGIMYAKGQGVPQDNVKAYLWIGLAAAQLADDPVVAGLPKEILKALSEERMSPSQVKEAEGLIEQWRPQ